MGSFECWKCRNLFDYKQSLIRHMRHQHSEENDAYDADTNDDDNINDSKDIFKENITNLSKRYDDFGHFCCHKFGNQETLEPRIMLKNKAKSFSI